METAQTPSTDQTSISNNQSAQSVAARSVSLEKEQKPKMVHSLQSKPVTIQSKEKGKNMGKKQALIIGVLVVILGISSGFGLAITRNGGSITDGFSNEASLKREVSNEEITVGTKVGIADEATFKDKAEGQLEKGGIDGEGSHHLVRPGGETQTVYITSSVIDLDQFIGRKVKIWGETMAADKAGWFMDIGKLEVLE